jgi:hypothetical protein
MRVVLHSEPSITKKDLAAAVKELFTEEHR